MLSKTKLTFSLTSFIVLIAFGLVCAVPSAFADGDANVNALRHRRNACGRRNDGRCIG